MNRHEQRIEQKKVNAKAKQNDASTQIIEETKEETKDESKLSLFFNKLNDCEYVAFFHD
jgi:hypothetical protein